MIDEVIRSYSNRSMAIAKTAAMSIDLNEFWDALYTNEKNEHYKRLQEQFEKIKDEENLLYFYAGTFDPETGMTMYIEGHGDIFGLNGHVPLSIFPQAAFDTFEYGTAHVTDIYILNIDGSWGISRNDKAIFKFVDNSIFVTHIEPRGQAYTKKTKSKRGK